MKYSDFPFEVVKKGTLLEFNFFLPVSKFGSLPPTFYVNTLLEWSMDAKQDLRHCQVGHKHGYIIIDYIKCINPKPALGDVRGWIQEVYKLADEKKKEECQEVEESKKEE